MSNNSFIEECFKIIKDRNIDFLFSGHPLGMKFSESTSKLRLRLQRMETEMYGKISRPRISDSRNVRRDITPKYQLDYLREDIIQISNSSLSQLLKLFIFFRIPQRLNTVISTTNRIHFTGITLIMDIRLPRVVGIESRFY